MEQFTACLDDPATAQEVERDITAGQINGVSGTPGFLINGTLVRGAQPYVVFEKVLDRELKRLGITKADRPTTEDVAPSSDVSSQQGGLESSPVGSSSSDTTQSEPVSAPTTEAGL